MLYVVRPGDTIFNIARRFNTTIEAILGEPLPYGTEVIVRRWFIPSPIGEDFPPAGLAVWDQVQRLDTGQVGYLLRVGYSQTVLM